MTLMPMLRRAAPTVLFAALMAASLGLASCITLFPKAAPVQLYRFETAAIPEPAGATRTVAVQQTPGAFTPAAAGDRLLSITGSQAAYISGARWISSAQSLFNAAATRSLEAAPQIRLSVPGELARPQYILRLDVLTFETRYSAPDTVPTVVIEVRASLFNARERSAAGTILLTAAQPATENRVSAIVEAYSGATTQIMNQLQTWITRLAS